MQTTTQQQAVNAAQAAVSLETETLAADNAALKAAQDELDIANLINQLEALTFQQAIAINQLMGNDPDNKNGVSINYPVPA